MIDAFVTATSGQGLYEVTASVQAIVARSGLREGLCTVYLQHTSASLLIQENADPTVQRDLQAWLARLVVEGDALFQHRVEGPDDMAAHVKAVLTGTSVAVPIVEGRLALGTWQGIFLWEHRHQHHQRRCVVHLRD